MHWLKNKETQTSWLSLETLILKENIDKEKCCELTDNKYWYRKMWPYRQQIVVQRNVVTRQTENSNADIF